MPATISLFNDYQISEEQINHYWEEGYVVIPNLLTREAAETLRNEILGIFQESGMPQTKLSQTPEYLAGSNIDHLVNGSEVLDVSAKLLRGSTSLFCIFTAVKAGGGGGRFHFHQDNQYTRFDGPGINLWFALQKMTPENGCIQLIPGSHKEGTLAAVDSGDGDTHKRIAWEPSNFIPVPMEPGDCVAFTRLTVHGSGVNNTSEPRIGYAVQLHRDDTKAKFPDGEIRLLKETPRYNLGPVAEISRFQEGRRIEGH